MVGLLGYNIFTSYSSSMKGDTLMRSLPVLFSSSISLRLFLLACVASVALVNPVQAQEKPATDKKAESPANENQTLEEAEEVRLGEEDKGPQASPQKTYELLNLFGEVFERVREDYVEPTADKKLVESAINGMLTSLDPHSSYLNEDDFKEMQVQTKGEFGGLGIEVTMENGLIKVVTPIDDTPAFRAGIQSGDLISEIEGEQVMGLTLSEAVQKMRGAVGSKIKLTIIREGASEPIEKTLVRDVIKIQTVRSKNYDDIGYIRITSFAESTSDLLQDELKKMLGKDSKVKGLILDLRNNPGGLLDQAVSVSDTFLEGGEIVSTRGRNPRDTRRYSARPGDLTKGMPVVVIINGGSASAAEIVSGALQDQKRAVVMGTKSFGKGSVQTVIPMGEYGAMRLTTSRYYTPSGRSIQAKGIVPDIAVEQAKIQRVDGEGKSVQEADLRGRLKNEQDDKKAEKVAVEKPQDEAIKPDSKDKKDDKKLSTSQVIGTDQDFQLARAIDLLRGLSVYRQTTAPAKRVGAKE